MLLEQLLTAGTTTEICIWHLCRRYRKLLRSTSPSTSISSATADTEAQQPRLGSLKVFYFAPGAEDVNDRCSANKLHFKSVIIDDNIVVLGSGNMDRASWYTSQELGVAFASRELAAQVQEEFRTFLLKDDGEGKYLTQAI